MRATCHHRRRRGDAGLVALLPLLAALLLAPVSMAGPASTDLSASATGCTAKAGSAAAATGDPLVTAATPAPARGAVGYSGKVLIVQDGDPWGFPANQLAVSFFRGKYDVITSAQLATTSLTPYRAVIYASVAGSPNIPATYANLAAHVARVEAYVYAGGTLLAHMATYGMDPPPSHFLPANVGITTLWHDDVTVISATDSVASGLPRGVATITDANIDGWSSSTHGYVTALPFNAKKVISIAATGDAAYAVYPYGKGRVRVTMMPVEFAYEYGLGSPLKWALLEPALLLNEIATVLPRPAFLANPYGWRFRNGGDTSTSDDHTVWAALFGDTPESLGAMQSKTIVAAAAGRASLYAGGQSFGLAATAGAYFNNYRTFADAGIAAKTTPWSWGTWGTANIFNGTRTVGTSPALRLEVQKHQIAFNAAPVFDVWAANRLSRSSKTLGRSWSTSYAAGLKAFATDLTRQLRWGPQVVVLTRGKVSHAVLAYKAVTGGSGTSRYTNVSICDPNYPGIARVLTLKSGIGKWTYAFRWRKGSTNATYTMGSAYSGDRISWVSPALVTRTVKDAAPAIAPDAVNAPDF